MNPEIIRVDESTFSNMPDEWQELLVESDADDLFLSWAWQFAWWKTWGASPGFELYLHLVKIDGKLVGIFPLYISDTNYPLGFQRKRLQFIGNCWREKATVRTEYMGPIIHTAYQQVVIDAFVDVLFENDFWVDLIICDQAEGSKSSEIFALALKEKGAKSIVRDTSLGVKIPTVGSFSDYISSLGKNTRLKIFGRRAYAQNNYADFAYLPVRCDRFFFSQLNKFHDMRWGKPCFSDKAVDFHLLFLHKSATSHIEICCSKLVGSGNVISLLYNLRANGNEYNIQSGYEQDFNPKISLGTLNIGYAIESCFESDEIMNYDFLAGNGKNTNYKAHYSSENIRFRTIQFVRNPFMKVLLGMHFSLGSAAKSLKKKFKSTN